MSGVRGRVRRPRHVHLRALDRHGQPFEHEWQGVRAAIVQHEVDHLDGVLHPMRMKDLSLLVFDSEWDKLMAEPDPDVPGADRVDD